MAHAAQQDMRVFKLVLIGDGGVGKTTLTMMHLTGQFKTEYEATIGYEVHSLFFRTTKGLIKFNVWEIAGQEKFGKLRNEYYAQSDCAIIMFDINSRITSKNVPNWHYDISRICKDIPIVLTGNKVEIKDRKVKVKVKVDKILSAFCLKKEMPYYEISAKLKQNFEKPFLGLARQLLGDDQLHFVGNPALQCPELQFDEATKQKYEAELAAAHEMPLPEDDDEDL